MKGGNVGRFMGCLNMVYPLQRLLSFERERNIETLSLRTMFAPYPPV
jgi:hypothetical protein